MLGKRLKKLGRLERNATVSGKHFYRLLLGVAMIFLIGLVIGGAYLWGDFSQAETLQ